MEHICMGEHLAKLRELTPHLVNKNELLLKELSLLQNFFDMSSEICAIIDAERGRFLRVNKQFEFSTGICVNGEIPFIDVFHTDDVLDLGIALRNLEENEVCRLSSRMKLANTMFSRVEWRFWRNGSTGLSCVIGTCCPSGTFACVVDRDFLCPFQIKN